MTSTTAAPMLGPLITVFRRIAEVPEVVAPWPLKTELPLNTLQPYTSTILIVLAALLLGFTNGPWYFAGGLLPALVSFLGTRELLGKVRNANEQKCFLDEQPIQSKKLADIGELSSGIAHEINNPLAIIGQESEWVNHLLQSDELRDFKQIHDLTDSLREITRQVKRCKEVPIACSILRGRWKHFCSVWTSTD